MSFFDLLRARAEDIDSWVCVGLDPVMGRLPAHLGTSPDAMSTFLVSIVEATHDVALCYKPNLAFYLAEGIGGMQALSDMLEALPAGVPVILDFKAGDIGSTAAAYARAAFDVLGVDAVTVNPYVGDEAVYPFAHYADKGVYILARTSNPDSARFQNHHDLWRVVVEASVGWNCNGNLGLVVGATLPEELQVVRQAAPDLPFLIPGVGAQGGDLAAAVAYGPTASGVPPVINSSRGILYASRGEDFAHAAREATIELRDAIRRQAGR
jgi:orotidine-5'-phosphate decarboxylase